MPLNYQQYQQQPVDNQNFQINNSNYQTPTNSRSDRKRARQTQTPPSANSQNNANFGDSNNQQTSSTATSSSTGNNKIKLDVLLGGYDAYLKTSSDIKRFRLSVLRPPKEGKMCKGNEGRFEKTQSTLINIQSFFEYSKNDDFCQFFDHFRHFDVIYTEKSVCG